MRKIDLMNGTALVTGATSGIGRAITHELVQLGYSTLVCGRSSSALEEISKTTGAVGLAFDLKERGALRERIRNEKIDVLVNNAGIISQPVRFTEMKQSDIDETLEVNLYAAISVVRDVLPAMVNRRKGHIFFTGSIAGHSPMPKMAVYGASKSALSSFAASLRCDLAGTGVRVTEIVAGRVETNLYRDALDDEKRRQLYADTEPVQPQDVAQMVSRVLTMPSHVNVTRFDIMPTAQFVGGSGFAPRDK